MEFSPFNPIVKLCIQGMALEESGNIEAATKVFLQGWKEATADFEKFLTAYYIARLQNSAADTLHWLDTTLQFALKINDDSVKSAFPSLYLSIAKCHEDLNNLIKAKEFQELSHAYNGKPSDKGPFYHGTKADMKIGDLLTPGGISNYQSEIRMNHIYFTALVTGAVLAAAMANGTGRERVYVVEPTSDFENDPNLTNKKFPGNLTRSYRSAFPIMIVGEVINYEKPNAESLQKFREKAAKNKGSIIN